MDWLIITPAMSDDYSTISGVRWLCEWSADAQQNII